VTDLPTATRRPHKSRPVRSEERRGTLIAGVGIPGCGKSTVARELAQLVQARVFVEPEASDWPAAVTERDVNGRFTGMSWFRTIRVPTYFEADAIRSKGGIAILDSYFDKLCTHWLGAKGMEWLMSPVDPYFEIAKKLADLDWERLPLADAIITFEVEKATWKRLLKARSRQLDDQFGIPETFATQHYFVEAAEELAHQTGCRVVHFQQKFDSPRNSAQRLAQDLKAAGVRLKPLVSSQFPEVQDPPLRNLVEAAMDAVGSAFAPHSSFRVGAAIRTQTGRIFTGCNVENDSYSLTSCAERNAIFAAVRAEGAVMTVSAVAVYAQRGAGMAVPRTVPPCGACRQVIAQFGTVTGDTTVTFLKDGRFTTMRISDLLPVVFEL
jgi:homotetrameric cytidine deaminase